ncbi:MAG: hypothetical protein SF187_24445 [Deltaproteobacteria bacterium]|nr:hypothetical protein [Deltaproteobacteria bacterium]
MARKKTNELGVKNSLVNNINAHKERGDSKPKEKSSVSRTSYKAMHDDWGHKPRKATKAQKATKGPHPAKKRVAKARGTA